VCCLTCPAVIADLPSSALSTASLSVRQVRRGCLAGRRSVRDGAWKQAITFSASSPRVTGPVGCSVRGRSRGGQPRVAKRPMRLLKVIV
jgi:hypothetical protein